QNSYPGITNKMLAGKVQKICVAYQGMEKFFPKDKIVLTGNPVRQDIKNLEAKRERAIEHFELDKNKKTILVIGGSLGAKTINESIDAGLEKIVDKNMQLLWQTGKWYAGKAAKAVESFQDKHIKTMPFIAKMDYAYAVADLVISRAGASSISELCIAAKATVFVPSPNVAEDHQTKNAMALVNQNAALLVKDMEAKNKLVPQVLEVLDDELLLTKLRRNISKMAFNDSAEIIADEVIKFVD